MGSWARRVASRYEGPLKDERERKKTPLFLLPALAPPLSAPRPPSFVRFPLPAIFGGAMLNLKTICSYVPLS